MDAERLCLRCMREGMTDGRCSLCGEPALPMEPRYRALPPRTVLRARYLLGRVLESNRVSIAYIALDLASGRRVSVHEYMDSLACFREKGRLAVTYRDNGEAGLSYARFLQQAQSIRRLSGMPGISRCEAFFLENQTAYYVLTLLEGCDLEAYLRAQGGRVSFARAVGLLRPLMLKLDRVHQRGVFFGDLTPENIVLRGGNADDLVKRIELDNDCVALGERYIPIEDSRYYPYAPEEIIISSLPKGPWSDVYAMAAILCRCVAGQPPPRRGRFAKSAARLDGSLPKRQERALLRGLANVPDGRCLRLREFAEDLRRSLGQKEEPTAEHGSPP